MHFLSHTVLLNYYKDNVWTKIVYIQTRKQLSAFLLLFLSSFSLLLSLITLTLAHTHTQVTDSLSLIIR